MVVGLIYDISREGQDFFIQRGNDGDPSCFPMRHANGKLSIIYADNRRLFLVVITDFRKDLVVKYIGDTFIFIVIIDG